MIAKLDIEDCGCLKGTIFVNNNSKINSITQLGNGLFAFVDKESTMGYLMPMHALIKAGLDKKVIENKFIIHQGLFYFI
jgi:ABC-type phosphate/phosphonate transport system substrate-binding protein